jgi:pSer/pThr/pTyr-binding forkhead associated (FHA) protein
VSEPLLAVLRLCLLALLYLFFLRVLRAVWTEMRPPKPAVATVAAAPAARPARGRDEGARRRPQLRIVEPEELSGRLFDLDEELTIGRAAGCQITLDDTFVSQLHARVFRREGQFLVEDLGSTNGTYLNRQKVTGPMVLRPGDELQIGNTILELA